MLKTNKKDFNSLKGGFTLIELLIVIVIIGILAVLVLSTINPIEQRNKANDTALRSTSGELLNAIERYYASNGYYPWEAPGVTDSPTDASPVVGNSGWFTKLVDSGEVKPEFQNRDDLTKLIFFYEAQPIGPTALVKLCFSPQSQTFRQNHMKFSSAGEYVGLQDDPDNYDGLVCVPE